MARVARGGHLLVSVPREPLWRGLNMARGAYIKDLGNTPGHLNHWSRKAFVELLVAARHGRGDPLPVPVDHAARQRCDARPDTDQRSGYGAGAKILSIGIASTGVVTFAYFCVASLRAERRRRLQGDLAAVVGAVRDRVGDLPADRAAALAHDRRPPGARLRDRPPAAHAAADPGGRSRSRSWSSR